MEFDRTPVPFMDANKKFTDGGKPLGLTAVDFWRFQFSNIWDMYEEVAEFIVNKALGLEVPFNKNGSTLYDIDYHGKRVEVKATAYYHSWRKEGEFSKVRTFSIAETWGQHNEKKEKKARQNDVYVFCLNTGKNRPDADPFEMSHWEFYVIPTSVINEQCGNGLKIALGRVRSITDQKHGIRYSELKAAVDAALQ